LSVPSAVADGLTLGINHHVGADGTDLCCIGRNTPFDATLVLRCVAGGPTNCALTQNQKLAANANGSVDGNSNPTITTLDATLILRYVAAGAPNANTGQVGNCKFDPVSRPYSALSNLKANENYTAILIGEVNGSWTPPN
jgi:hypothetical protein